MDEGVKGGFRAKFVSLLAFTMLFPHPEVYSNLMLSPVCAAALLEKRMRTTWPFKVPESTVAELDMLPTNDHWYPVAGIVLAVARGNAGAVYL